MKAPSIIPVVLILFFSLILGSCSEENEQFHKIDSSIRKHALVIGIERVDPSKHNGKKYTYGTWKAEKDAEEFVRILRKSDFDLIKHLQTESTEENIKHSIIECSKNLKDGDLFLIYIRSHGIQIPDTPPIDETDSDGLDEAIPVFDGLLVDDEINRLLNENFVNSTNIILLSDLCSSETIYKIEKASPLQVYEKSDDLHTYNLLNIAAASDSKLAHSISDIIADRLRFGHGDFIDALIKALKYDQVLNYKELYDRIKPRMVEAWNSATPTYSIVGDESFFVNNFNLIY